MQGDRTRKDNVTHGYETNAFSLSFRRQAYEAAVVAQHEFVEAGVRAAGRFLRRAIESHSVETKQRPHAEVQSLA